MLHSNVIKSLAYECVIGQRGIVKTSHMWLAVAVIGCTKTSTAIELLLATMCFSQFCVLINDLADKEADSKAGKVRPITQLPPLMAQVFTWGIFITGGIILGMFTLPALPVYLAAALLGGPFYSCGKKPLKVRGILGPLCYTAAVTLAYVLMPWVALGHPAAALPFLLVPMLLEKWVHLHFHQIVDYQSDLHAGLNTWATQQGEQKARKQLHWLTLLASLSFIACSIYLTINTQGGPLAGAAVLLSATAVTIHLSRQKFSTALTRELPSYYLALSFALYRVAPPLLLLTATWKQPSLWPLPLIAGATTLIEVTHSIRYRYK